MSAAFLRIAKDMLRRDAADLATVDVWETRKFLTPTEAEEARAYWHETHPVTDGETSDTDAVTN